MATRVGYIGIGIMGCGIVTNLRKADIPVSFVVHSNRERVSELADVGAAEVNDYPALSEASDVIMMTVPDSSVVEPLLLDDDGIGPHLREGQIVVDMSTSYPPSTRKIAPVLEARGVALLDAPLTGSRPQAETGTLNVMCGGSKEAFDKVKPLFDAIAANIFHVGGVGSGHAIKLINNFLGQTNVAAICEILPFARKYGVDLQVLFDVVSVSGGNSKAFQGLMPRLIERDFGTRFQQKFVHKDLRYINNLAREQGIPAPLAAALLTIHDMALANGYGEKDMSSLALFWEKISQQAVDGPGS